MQHSATKIHGAVEVYPSQDSKNLHTTERQEDTTQKGKEYSLAIWSFRLAISALVVSTLYFGATCLIFWQTKKSADISNLALHVSEKAYIALQTPVLDEDKGFVDIAIDNNGRLQATDFETILHERTCNAIVQIPPGLAPQRGMISCPEYHRTRLTFPSIAPGPAKARMVIPLPAFSKENTDIGEEAIEISGTVKYNDGFPDDPIEQWTFCFQTTYHLITKAVYWGDCDAKIVIPQMEALESHQGESQK